MTLLSTQIDWDAEGRQRVLEYFLVLLLFKNSLSLENGLFYYRILRIAEYANTCSICEFKENLNFPVLIHSCTVTGYSRYDKQAPAI